MNEHGIRIDKKTVLSFLISFAILYLIITQADLPKTVEVIKNTNTLIFALAFSTLFLSLSVRGLRWKRLLENIGFKGRTRDATEILMLAFFANCVVPAKLGDLYRCYIVKKNYGLPISKVYGTVFAERVIDIIAMAVLFLVAALMSFGSGDLPKNIAFYVKAITGISVLLIIVLFIFKYQSEKITRLIPSRVEDIFKSFKDGTFDSFARPSLTIIASYTIIILALDSLRLFLVVKATGITLSYFLSLIVYVVSAALTGFPITPAGLGAVEAGMAGILMMFGVGNEHAVSIALLDRLISYWGILIIGWIVYAVSKKK